MSVCVVTYSLHDLRTYGFFVALYFTIYHKNSSIYKETKKQGKVLLQRVPLFFGSKSKNIEFDSRDF